MVDIGVWHVYIELTLCKILMYDSMILFKGIYVNDDYELYVYLEITYRNDASSR